MVVLLEMPHQLRGVGEKLDPGSSFWYLIYADISDNYL